MRTMALFILAALAAAPAQARTADPGRGDDVNVDADACEVVRIAPNGARTVTPPRRPGSGGASVVQHGAGSSVSVTSRGGGSSTASSSVSTGGRTHSITTTQDDKGCRVVIDERSSRGESQ